MGAMGHVLVSAALKKKNEVKYSKAGSASGKMKRILCSDWQSRVGKVGLSCPLGIARFVPAKERFFGAIFWSYNKSLIDQPGSVPLFLRFYGHRFRLGP